MVPLCIYNSMALSGSTLTLGGNKSNSRGGTMKRDSRKRNRITTDRRQSNPMLRCFSYAKI